MTEEIYEDVLKEEPKEEGSEAHKKWEKRLHKSVGWISPMVQGKVFAKEDKNGKLKPCSDVLDDEIVWDVQMDKFSSFTCDNQENAEILSYLAQVNERLKRVEKKLNE